MDEEFNLKWTNFPANTSKTFAQLRKEKEFLDVTLVSSDRKHVSAHRVVLSACSDYFKTILKLNKQGSPILCLENVSYQELSYVVDYIYNGEVNLEEKYLERFLSIAERFNIEGLQVNKDEEKHEKVSKHQPTVPALKIQEQERSHFLSFDHITNVPDPEVFTLDNGLDDIEDEKPKHTSIKTTIKHSINSEVFSNIEELDEKIRTYLTKIPGRGYECNECKKNSKDFSHAKEHVEIHFEGLSFPCQFCDKMLKSRHAFRKHSTKCKLSFFKEH